MEIKARAHVFVTGLVQGVNFRFNTASKARKLGIRGWVRNLPDGRVEAVLEGEKSAVDKLIEWCRVGPPGAIVEDLELAYEQYTGEFEDFRISY